MTRKQLLLITLLTGALASQTIAASGRTAPDRGELARCREGLEIDVGGVVQRLRCREDWTPAEPKPVSIDGERFVPPLNYGAGDPAAIDGIELPEFPQRLYIVSTRELVSESTMFQRYVNWRRAGGWEVIIGTEWDWDYPVEEDGDDRPARIRAWLAESYADHGAGYLVLIGSPDPFDGIPPRATQPLSAGADCLPPSIGDDMSNVPTDHYFADLESDWDCDGDLLFGEFVDDTGAGCADWGPELIVGRLPVYGGAEVLDRLLNGILDYEQAGDKSYRDRAIFAGAFGGFQGQASAAGDGSVYGANDDLAGFLYRTAADLPPFLEIEQVRLFEEAGIVTSNLAHEGPLTTERLIEEWFTGASTVSWGGHGSSRSTHRQVWNGDWDLDELAGWDEVSAPSFMTSSNSGQLGGAPRAVVHMMSCLNGYPEDGSNLGTALLVNGAIATVSASRVAVGAGGEDWEPLPELAEATTHSYYFTRLVQAGYPVGDAVAFTRWGIPGMGWEAYEETDFTDQAGQGAYAWLTKFEYNLYGDPTISLERCDADADCDDDLPCNGTERCADGYCVHDDPVECPIEHDNPCLTQGCNNATGQCELVDRPDGLPCEDGQWCTVDDFCFQGSCSAGGPRDCPGTQGYVSTCVEEIDSCDMVKAEEVVEGSAGDDCSVAGIPGAGGAQGLISVLKAIL